MYLHDIDASIAQDIRYYHSNNFIGRPVKGYWSPVCILTRQAAVELAQVQKVAQKKGYHLKVYDCYRPQQAVNDFYQWSQHNEDVLRKSEFYPRVAKSKLFSEGYIALYSGHSRGSTVDVTLVKSKDRIRKNNPLTRCYDKTSAYLNDDSINMGTRFDCLDPAAHVYYPNLSGEQKRNRRLLNQLMRAHGFEDYSKEWWHFTLKNEPYPRRYFNFPVD